MKARMIKISITASLISLALFIAAVIMAAQKANIDIDTISASRFDFIMGLYKAGAVAKVIAAYVACAAGICWIITGALIKRRGG